MTDTARIHVLPDPLINQIAAGEVVERPASVVKELLENALDAGATRISVKIEHGGKRRIRITDDGCGIHPDDMRLAVTRHATSKIKQLDDLNRGGSLGFRGEALPSIASVSHLTLKSAREGAAEGCEITLSGGVDPVLRPAPPQSGTSVDVTDLFFNTPARAKYLKADATEWGHISEAVTEVALNAPGVHFSLSHNGKPARVMAAVNSLAERVRQIWPKELTEQLIAIDQSAPDGSRVTGLIARPGFSHSGRNHQKLLVNGRCVKNGTIGHAIYSAYETALPGGRHPVFFLALSVNPAQVDVNVHPAKREVRLAASSQVHHFVREAVREALGGYRGNTLRLTCMSPTGSAGATPATWEDRVRQAAVASTHTAREPVAAYAGGAGVDASAPAQAPLPLPETVGGDARAAGPMRVIGQLHNTFLLVEQGTELRIVDQHTAHERVLYERLLARFKEGNVPSQHLLIPRDLTLPGKAGAAIAEHAGALGDIGIEVEPFGGDGFLLRSLPEVLKQADPQELLTDIADDLIEHSKDTGDAIARRLHPVLATMACHAAVKAGDALQPEQMRQLVADLDTVDNPHTCPHGRAVTAVLDKGAVKHLFDRNWGN
ncbi:MAG: DNA mismatch repair endonuclease MutL [Leptospirillia bacterium]